MSESESHLLVASFSDENTATGVLQSLLTEKRDRNLGVLEAAVIRKEDNGQITIKEEGEIGAGVGAVAGGLLGSILGIFRGAPIAGTGLGAVLGGAAAQAYDSGIPDARLHDIARSLPNGSSAIVAVVDAGALAESRTLLKIAGATVTDEPIILPMPGIDVPNTGNKSFDDWADKAAATIAGYAGQAEEALSGLAGKAEDAYRGTTTADKAGVGDAGHSEVESPAIIPPPVARIP